MIFVGEVDSCFFKRITGTAQRHVREVPELEKPRIDLVRGRKENIGVKKQPVHLFRSQMWNRIRVKAQLPNLFSRPAVVGVVDCVG